MVRKTQPISRRIWKTQIIALGFLAVTSSFFLGIQTAGDVETIAPSQAGGVRITGDINNDNRVNEQDVILILEIVRGYEEATPDQLLSDPNGDGHFTIDDAIRLLHDLATQS